MNSDTDQDNNTEPAEPQRPDSSAANNNSTTTARDHRTSADEAVPKEVGGRSGPDPVRYGDWEKKGRCIDF